MDVVELAARMKGQIRAEYLRANIRIVNPARVDRTGGVSKFEVIDALTLLGEQGVLTRRLDIDCGHGHTMWSGDAGNFVTWEQSRANPEGTRGRAFLKGKLREPYECGGCGDDGFTLAFADLHFRIHWRINKQFEADIDLWVKQAEFVEYHVDTGAAPRTVALSVGRAATPVPLLPQDVEDFIREMTDAGRLVRDMATGFVYVAMWYPKTIAQVRADNDAWVAKGGTP